MTAGTDIGTDAERYDSFFSTPKGKKIAEEEARLVLDWLLTGEGVRKNKKMRFLSVGCGTGYIEKLVTEKAENASLGVYSRLKITCVEPDPAMAEKARSRGLTVVEASAESLPFPEEYFDGVFYITSLEFVENPEGALRETKRVLKTGGRLAVLILNTDSRHFKQQMGKEGYISRHIKTANWHVLKDRICGAFTCTKTGWAVCGEHVNVNKYVNIKTAESDASDAEEKECCIVYVFAEKEG